MKSYKAMQIEQQKQYCTMLMSKIDSNVFQRELKRNDKGYLPISMMPKQLTKTAIQREITELRAALLELSRMLEV